jgi:cell division protein FtsL
MSSSDRTNKRKADSAMEREGVKKAKGTPPVLAASSSSSSSSPSKPSPAVEMELESLRAELLHARKTIAELKEKIAEQDDKLLKAGEAFIEHDDKITALRATVDKQKAKNSDLRGEIKELKRARDASAAKQVGSQHP